MGQANSNSSGLRSDAESSSSASRSDHLTAEEIRALPLVPHHVYAVLSEHVYNDPDRRELPQDWTVLMTCAEVDLDREGYFAAAYVNHTVRHCIIAERGTSDALGVRAGVWMYFDEPTIQFSLAEQFSKLVRMRLSLGKFGAYSPVEGGVHHQQPYFISYTGHSLGAVLAACRACAEHTFAITFESPGCKTFVEKTMHPFRADDVDIITYLRSPNPINTLKPQCGYLVQLPYVTASGSVAPPLINAAASPAVTSTPPSAQPQLETSSGNASPSSAAGKFSSFLPNVISNRGSSNGATAASSSTLPTAAGGAAASAAVSAPAAAPPLNKPSVASTIASNFSKIAIPTLPSPHEYIRSRIIGIAPELQQYITKIEPMLKELLEHTQQIHSIHSIVSNFELEDEPPNQEVVLVWPAHLMQFLEYYNITKAMEDPQNQNSNVYAAYDSLLQKLYRTAKRPKSRIPLRFLQKDARKLVRVWSLLRSQQKHKFPLSDVEVRALNMTSIHGENLQTASGITAFQMKQYLSIILARDEVRVFLDNFTTDFVDGSKASKL